MSFIFIFIRDKQMEERIVREYARQDRDQFKNMLDRARRNGYNKRWAGGKTEILYDISLTSA
jgi:hypothetical protein